jgi:uncharacterized cupin superfamily protein
MGRPAPRQRTPVNEAKLSQVDEMLIPEGPGWFVLNAADARWWQSKELGAFCPFEGSDRFPEIGVNLNVVEPGQPSCMYHGENRQENFLVLSGECILIVEGTEHPLRAWDFVHCPAWTEHVIVGAGAGPCLFLAVGARGAPAEVRYPVNPTAARHCASVLTDTSEPSEAYARFGKLVARPSRPGDLPAR